MLTPRANGDARWRRLELLRKAHWAIDKVSADLRRFAFNTAIAAVMELLNECSRLREEVERGQSAVRARDGRLAAVPVRAARQRRRPTSC